MRIGLFIRSTRGLSVLKTALDVSIIDLKFVIYDDDPSIRDNCKDEILSLCSKHNIICYSRENQPSILEEVDYNFFIAWRFIEKTNSGQSIIFHDSDLPRYRGYSPTVSMLINGEPYLAVTAFFMSDGYDEGPIILQKKIEIKYPITLREAFHSLSQLYAEIMGTLLEWINKGVPLPATHQDEQKATYSMWRDEYDLYLDWSQSSDMLKRKIDALGFPYDGARTLLGDKILVINDAMEIPDKVFENRDHGKIFTLDGGRPCVICGKGMICLTDLIYLDSGETVLPMKKSKQRFSNAY